MEMFTFINAVPDLNSKLIEQTSNVDKYAGMSEGYEIVLHTIETKNKLKAMPIIKQVSK